MNAESRFLAYAVGQTVALGLLAGVAGAMVLFTPVLGGVQHGSLAVETSGPVARATHRLLQVLTPAMLVLYVVLPAVAGGVLSVFGEEISDVWGTGFVTFALLLLFLALFAVTPLFVGGAAEAVVETRSGSPQVAFAFEYEPTGDGRGVLTITHDAGDAVPAEYLVVRSDQLTDVAGANQTRSGPWQGATTDVDWRDERVVAPGDSVAVGVERDCVVRVVYADRATLGKYVCPGAESG